MKKINSIIIGCGNIGYGYDSNNPDYVQTHFRALSKDSRFNLLAVVENNNNIRKKIQKNHRIESVNCIGDLRNDIINEVDFIAISASDNFKIDILSQIADSKLKPKFILFEKPIARSQEEMTFFINAFSRLKCELRFNFMRRADPNYLWLSRNIEEILCGNPKLKFDIKFSGDMHNCLSHGIDFLLGLFGNDKFNNLDIEKLNKIWLIKNRNIELLIRNIEIGVSIFEITIYSGKVKIYYSHTDENILIKKVGSWHGFMGNFYTNNDSLELGADKYMSFTYDEVARFYNEGISSLTTIDEAVLTFNLIERLGAKYE
jgi:hypothetical protein